MYGGIKCDIDVQGPIIALVIQDSTRNTVT